MKQIKTLGDLTKDEQNANRHSVRGLAMLEQSLVECGTGRSVLVDKHGKLIAGNGTTEVALSLAGEEQEIILVPSDGTKLVVVQRTDLDLEADPAARKLAIADNRVGEVDLAWDPEQLQAALREESLGDVSWLFQLDELEAICGHLHAPLPAEEEAEAPVQREKSAPQFTLTLAFPNQRALKEAAQRLVEEGYTILRGAL